MSYNTDNYQEQGGKRWVVNQDLVVNGTADVKGTLRAKALSFDTTSPPATTAKGDLWWDDADSTLNLNVDGEDVTLQLGQEMFIRCVNKTGSTIANGSVVYVSGAQGNRPTIALADADIASHGNRLIGLTTETISNNEYGFVTIQGLVRGLNTTAYTEGDCVYLSQVAGQFTKTAPTLPVEAYKVGMVVKSHVNDGWICVHVGKDKSVFGDYDNGNYSYFEADGTLVSIGNAITYRDEYVGGDYFVPSGATAPDAVNITVGGVVTSKYAFDGSNTTEKLGNTFEIPHDLAVSQVNAGTQAIEFHIHFAPSTTGTGVVKWTLDWCLIKANGAPIAGTQGSATKTITANQQYYNLLCGCDLPVPSGGFGIGDLIEFTLSRNPSDAQDTYAQDAIFYKAALHIPIDTLGSRQRYVK